MRRCRVRSSRANEYIVLTPGMKWGDLKVMLSGDLGTILERMGNRPETIKTGYPY